MFVFVFLFSGSLAGTGLVMLKLMIMLLSAPAQRAQKGVHRKVFMILIAGAGLHIVVNTNF
jgi:hypothetical protein